MRGRSSPAALATPATGSIPFRCRASSRAPAHGWRISPSSFIGSPCQRHASCRTRTRSAESTAVQIEAIELLAEAERLHAQCLDLPGDIEVPGGWPPRDVRSRDLDGHRGLRIADRRVPVRHPQRADADAKRPGREVLGQGEEGGAAGAVAGQRHREVEIGGAGRHDELSAPQAGDVDAHVDGRRAEADAAWRRRAGRHVDVVEREPQSPRAELDGAHASGLSQRVGEKRLDALARERGAPDQRGDPRGDEEEAGAHENREESRAPPAKPCGPHGV